MYYSAIGILALLVLVIENLDILLGLDVGFDKPAWKVYRKFLFSILVYYITDILWGILEALKIPVLLFADTSLYFIAMAVGILLWTKYVVTYLDEKDTFGNFLVHAGRILAACVTVISLVNIFAPVLFTVDDECVYTPLPIRYAILIVQIVLLFLISIHALQIILAKKASGDRVKRYRATAYFGLIMSTFLIAQVWLPYLPMYCIAYLLGTCLLRAFVVRMEKEEYRLENAEMKRIRQEELLKEEHTAYRRISALAGDFLCVYIVDPESGDYREFNSADEFKSYDLATKGTDFFNTTMKYAKNIVCAEDWDKFSSMFSREAVLDEIEKVGIYLLEYRIILQDRPNYVQLKAAILDEEDEHRLIVGINDVDALVRREEDYAARLANAQSMANIDALTGVKNRHAYLEAEERLNEHINDGDISEFAIVILDVNDLKKVNDTLGHQAGDKHLRGACKIICDTFKRSPVFRIGGDEFAVIVRGEDYERVDRLVSDIDDQNRKAVINGGVVVACGMSKFEGDDSVTAVFRRADRNMYDNKVSLKSGQ